MEFNKQQESFINQYLKAREGTPHETNRKTVLDRATVLGLRHMKAIERRRLAKLDGTPAKPKKAAPKGKKAPPKRKKRVFAEPAAA